MTEDERRAYEEDLEMVLDYLDNPPEPGSPEDHDFAMRLRRVEENESAFTAEPTGPEVERPSVADKYRQRLAALRAAIDKPPAPGFTEGGEDGLGPTLGMDVGRS